MSPHQKQHVESVDWLALASSTGRRRKTACRKPGLKAMVISVKGGNTGPTHVRDIASLIKSEPDTEMAGFICLHEPTKLMLSAAAQHGTFTYADVEYPRVQILSIKDILEGKREFKTPSRIGSRITTGQGALPMG